MIKTLWEMLKTKGFWVPLLKLKFGGPKEEYHDKRAVRKNWFKPSN